MVRQQQIRVFEGTPFLRNSWSFRGWYYRTHISCKGMVKIRNLREVWVQKQIVVWVSLKRRVAQTHTIRKDGAAHQRVRVQTLTLDNGCCTPIRGSGQNPHPSCFSHTKPSQLLGLGKYLFSAPQAKLLSYRVWHLNQHFVRVGKDQVKLASGTRS